MRPLVVLLAFVAAIFAAAPARADKRVALLIGDGKYQAAPALSNPRRDVELLKSTLIAAGFDRVDVAFDLGQKPMLKALNAFADQAADADIAVLYYSGHGLEMGGVNYLVPVDAQLAADTDVADETVTLERAMQALRGAKRLKLVILDACRTNPFRASMKIKAGDRAVGDKGLAPVEPEGADTLVAFAAKAGTPASDGEGENSPFALALASRLAAPGDDVEMALRKVRDDVLAATHNKQEPFKYGSLGGSAIPLSKAAIPSGAGADDRQVSYDVAMGAGSVAALDAFLARYPDGGLAQSARRERDRLQKLAAITPQPIETSAVQIDRLEIVRAGVVTNDSKAQTIENAAISTGQRTVMKQHVSKVTTHIDVANVGMFGVQAKILGSPSGARVPLRIVWRYPAPGLRNPTTGVTKTSDDFVETHFIGQTDAMFSWVLGDAWTRVPGNWTLEFWSGSRRLASQSFTLEK